MESETESKPRVYANRHVGKFLALAEVENELIQMVHNGRLLTSQSLLKNKDLTLTRPIVILDSPASIGMKVLSFPRRKVTVRDVADIVGYHYPVHVIDVEYQEELEGWTLADLVEYFEDEERLFLQHQEEASALANSQTQRTRRRRKAAEKCLTQTALQRPRVLNQISLEFSKTPLRKNFLSPQFVRDLDWIDNAWPRTKDNNPSADDIYPNVQYYCLTSATGCYTDFHIDFGGTAVYYHILSGEKIFCLVRPTEKNLAAYEDWLCSPTQATTFFPDLIDDPNDVIRISLKESQTMIIPTAWIHGVYTPSDSLVLGGNFLHGLDMELQLKVHCIETRTRVKEQFRFPFFLQLNFYAGGMYLEKLRKGQVSKQEVDGLGTLIDALDEWWKVQKGASQLQTGPTVVGAAEACAKKNSCSSVEEFLSELRKEHQRVVEFGIVPNPSFVEADSSSLVKDSLIKPKLRLKLKSDVANSPPVPVGSASLVETDKFRIVVSSSKWIAATIPSSKRKRQREDTEWIDEGPVAADDEWVPSKSKKSNNDVGTRGISKPKQPPSTTPKPQPSVRSRPPSKSSTARQRLMKRFR